MSLAQKIEPTTKSQEALAQATAERVVKDGGTTEQGAYSAVNLTEINQLGGTLGAPDAVEAGTGTAFLEQLQKMDVSGGVEAQVDAGEVEAVGAQSEEVLEAVELRQGEEGSAEQDPKTMARVQISNALGALGAGTPETNMLVEALDGDADLTSEQVAQVRSELKLGISAKIAEMAALDEEGSISPAEKTDKEAELEVQKVEIEGTLALVDVMTGEKTIEEVTGAAVDNKEKEEGSSGPVVSAEAAEPRARELTTAEKTAQLSPDEFREQTVAELQTMIAEIGGEDDDTRDVEMQQMLQDLIDQIEAGKVSPEMARSVGGVLQAQAEVVQAQAQQEEYNVKHKYREGRDLADAQAAEIDTQKTQVQQELDRQMGLKPRNQKEIVKLQLKLADLTSKKESVYQDAAVSSGETDPYQRVDELNTRAERLAALGDLAGSRLLQEGGPAKVENTGPVSEESGTELSADVPEKGEETPQERMQRIQEEAAAEEEAGDEPKSENKPEQPEAQEGEAMSEIDPKAMLEVIEKQLAERMKNLESMSVEELQREIEAINAFITELAMVIEALDGQISELSSGLGSTDGETEDEAAAAAQAEVEAQIANLETMKQGMEKIKTTAEAYKAKAEAVLAEKIRAQEAQIDQAEMFDQALRMFGDQFGGAAGLEGLREQYRKEGNEIKSIWGLMLWMIMHASGLKKSQE